MAEWISRIAEGLMRKAAQAALADLEMRQAIAAEARRRFMGN